MEPALSLPQLPSAQPWIVPAPRPLPGLAPAPAAEEDARPRRDRIWDLASSLHCSIIGTCLPTGALRQLFTRLGQADAKTVSDHELHSRAVRIAGQRDLGAKMLNRMLEKRHEAHVKRFAKAASAAEVLSLWREALERGDIPGAYWAALTHPAADQPVVTEVFGDVHMLSHLVGTANRADIVRLRELERGIGERDERLARQDTRLNRLGRERDALARRVDELEQELRLRPQCKPAGIVTDEACAATALKAKLEGEQARSAQLAARIAEQSEALSSRDQDIRALQEQAASLRHEVAALEQALAGGAEDAVSAPEAAPDLSGRRLLYVGGRPKQLEQMRAVVARLGGELMSHDGGMEENTSLLPRLVGQADIAFFPVDCVSHGAMSLVKRFCREAGKPFVPLRSASVASFLVALSGI